MQNAENEKIFSDYLIIYLRKNVFLYKIKKSGIVFVKRRPISYLKRIT